MKNERRWFRRSLPRSVEACGCDPVSRAEARREEYRTKLLKESPTRVI